MYNSLSSANMACSCFYIDSDLDLTRDSCFSGYWFSPVSTKKSGRTWKTLHAVTESLCRNRGLERGGSTNRLWLKFLCVMFSILRGKPKASRELSDLAGLCRGLALHKCLQPLWRRACAFVTSWILLMSMCSDVDDFHTSPPSCCCLWNNRNPKGGASLCTEPIFTEPLIGFIEC